MLEDLTSQDFMPLMEQTFHLHFQAGQPPLEVRLVEVTEFGLELPAGRSARQPFSLIFHGPLSPALPQRIYALEHAALGVLDVFVVPLGPQQGILSCSGRSGPEQESMRYQVIFA
jgi:hypothetical protein